MTVIPVINCKTENCVDKRIKVFKNLDSKWVKFDISDGRFNPVVSWNDPESIKEELSDYKIEAHIMAQNPDSYIEEWIKAGADRIIVHIESDLDIEKTAEEMQERGIELMISKKPSTSLESFAPYLDKVKYFQFLAVTPGYSGQELQLKILDEIRSLRDMRPDVKIEVDGGIDEKTAEKAKSAGADIVVSSSYIFDSENPKEAFNKLKLI